MTSEQQVILQKASNQVMRVRREKRKAQIKKSEWLGDLCGVDKAQFKKEMKEIIENNSYKKIDNVCILDGFSTSRMIWQ